MVISLFFKLKRIYDCAMEGEYMGLQLIIGGSGTGKTTLMYQKLIAHSMADRHPACYAVVPEQFTMETQKNIVELSGRQGTMAIDIVSFQRLAKRIFDEAGFNRLKVLDDTGKCFILRKIIEENKNQFTVFGAKAGMAGFIEEMKSMISEFYQYGIVGDKFDDMLKTAAKRPLLHAKLKDVKLCMEKLNEFLGDRFTMNEELLSRACGFIEKSEIIRDSYITFDEYTGFSPVQYRMIRELLKYAKDVCVAVTLREAGKIDYGKENEADIFRLSMKTINKLKIMAKEENVEIYSDVILTENYRLQNKGALLYLEKNIFRYGVKPYDKRTVNSVENGAQEDSEISLHICDNTAAEAEYVAYTINSLVRQGRYRYKDIAVVTTDIESDNRYIEEKFRKHSVPCFVDCKRSVMANPMVETIRAVLNIISDNFSYESVFGYLKSGMSGLNRTEIDLLENYVITHGIRGRKKWMTPIEDEREEYEAARRKVLEDILDFYDTFKSSRKITVCSALTALHNLVLRLQMEEKLEDITQKLIGYGDLSRAKELKQTYGIITELFDKLVFLVGDEMVNARELLAMLESGFEDIKVSIVPPTLDRVVVGDIERTRLNKVKVLFLIGVNDGLIPKAGKNVGVMTREERNFLYENGIELSPTMRENAFIQKFYLYLMLTKMSDRLYLSFKRSGSDGGSKRPSYLVNLIVGMIRSVHVTDETLHEEGELPKKITNLKAAYSYVAENMHKFIALKLTNEEERIFAQLYITCAKNGMDMEKLLSASTVAVKPTHIDRAVARVLYGENMHNSVSRLETFAECAYRHFITYGLSLNDRREYDVLKTDIGVVYHRVMELFFEKAMKRNLSFDKIDNAMRNLMVGECVSEIAGSELGKVFEDTGRNQYMLDKIQKVSDKTIWILQQQINAGDFIPSEFEFHFSSDRGLDRLKYLYDDGSQMGLRGVIDRIDYYKDGDDIYVKIIDYKSGSKKFEINDVYNGLQLQLVIYMEAALAHAGKKYPGKNIIPAGMFYYNIDNPAIKEEELTDTGDEEKNREYLDRLVLSKQKINGVVSDEEKVLRAFDNDIDKIQEGGDTSLYVPVSYNKKGGFKSNSSQIDRLSMDCMLSYVHNKVGKFGQEILEGEISVNPYYQLKGKGTACDYCEYYAICGFDKNLNGARYRLLNKEKAEEIWNAIRREAQHGMDKRTEESN